MKSLWNYKGIYLLASVEENEQVKNSCWYNKEADIFFQKTLI
jgi:hypothetical protein